MSDPGTPYTLTVAQLSPEGEIESRVDTPFLREDPARVAGLAHAGRRRPSRSSRCSRASRSGASPRPISARASPMCRSSRGKPRPHPRPDWIFPARFSGCRICRGRTRSRLAGRGSWSHWVKARSRGIGRARASQKASMPADTISTPDREAVCRTQSRERRGGHVAGHGSATSVRVQHRGGRDAAPDGGRSARWGPILWPRRRDLGEAAGRSCAGHAGHSQARRRGHALSLQGRRRQPRR